MKIPPQWTSRVGSIVLTALGLFLGLCLLTYSPVDSPLLSSHPQQPPDNLGGALGTWIALLGRGGFGWASLFIPVLCFLWAWRLWQGARSEVHPWSFLVAMVCLIASIGTIFALRGTEATVRTAQGGTVGFLLARAGSYYIGHVGTILAAAGVGLLAWLVVSGQTLRSTGVEVLRRMAAAVMQRFRRTPAVAGAGAVEDAPPAATPRIRVAGRTAEKEQPGPEPPGPSTPPVRVRSTIDPKSKSISRPAVRRAPADAFRSPSLDALDDPPPISERQLTEDLQKHARVLEETLRDFGIEGSVVNIDRGPAVTRYEVKPAPGIKLTKIVSLADELALVLKTSSCHVVAPIPGKGLVGIDVPNTTTTTVYLKEMLTAREFQGIASPLALPLGKDVSGRAIVGDLRDFPHLLIAGATGSGKTVFLNSLLVGMLTRTTPAQVRFLMIDPKMVELAVFNGIPHLITPVVTDTKKASAALYWAVHEMERRFQLFADAGSRNIQAYNERAAQRRTSSGPDEAQGDAPSEEEGPLPYLVVVIDELADLMMASSQDVEAAITRLAQLSRAVGIHIILATQRPSVDVVTGVIKANFPARIAFQVASKVDSRTILDMNGADKLLGRGDLLFLPPGAAKPLRAQGAYVSDAEIERVTSFLKEQGAPTYDPQLLESQRRPASAAGGWASEKDELYEVAKQLILDTGQASTSLLQRRLRLGYGRAARMLDQMEQEGLIGPTQGSRPREVLAGQVETTRRTAS